MTRDEARRRLIDNLEIADRVVRNAKSLRQDEILAAMGAREMAGWLLGILNGVEPWKS